MNNEILKNVVYQIAARLGLSVSAKHGTEKNWTTCVFLPDDGHPNESFSIVFQIGLRSASASIKWGQFSGALLNQMSNATEDSKEAFCVFSQALNSKKIRTKMRINGLETDPTRLSSWPKKWEKFELSLKTLPMEIDMQQNIYYEQLLLDLVLPLFGMMASLIGYEDNEPQIEGVAEGNIQELWSIHYERKKVNREACVQLKGTSCTVCGLNFLDKYGALGRGYIEVHHLKPLATQEPGYVLSIDRDLVPLCSNCHSMAHRETPPVSVKNLKKVLRIEN